MIVTGLVQGVGYRPFVAELAEKHNLSGQVKNVGGIVKIRVTGGEQALSSFVEELRTSAPEGANVKEISIVEKKVSADNGEDGGFRIVRSMPGEEKLRLLPPDLPVCPSCEKELLDPQNRRFLYPFISCVSCGPRFSIMKSIPYDRDSITMDVFPMCQKCRAEYTQKGNVRRHAQTIACPDCGPKLRLVLPEDLRGGNRESEKEPLRAAAERILSGKIAAIKDIGGFHFAFLPTVPEPSRRLRAFKQRDRKPFAVMFPDLSSVRSFCRVSKKEEELLLSPARPIVLLEKKKDFCGPVCGESDRMGVMLPCNPLQILLLRETGPLVMTSGNRGGEPIIRRDKEMEELMRLGCPDLILTHDREIVTPLEDSIYQAVCLGKDRYAVQILRRGRGMVPQPVFLDEKLPGEVFAAGGDLKAVFALGKGNAVYLSSHFGDLADARAVVERNKAKEHMETLLDIHPQKQVGDLHPAYVSSVETDRRVQHHHAHVASVIAEHHLKGPVIGVAFDGTGYGTDGMIWGSEFFLCEGAETRRMGCFRPVKLFGGDAGAKNAAGMLLAFLLEAEKRGLVSRWREWFCEGTGMSAPKEQLMEKAYAVNVQTVMSSSMGRLFDAVSALLGVAVENTYEGECAIALEQCARRAARVYPLRIRVEKINGLWQADSVGLISDLYNALQENVAPEELALGFHEAVAAAAVRICVNIWEDLCQGRREGPCPVRKAALSGGTFANRILMRKMVNLLEKQEFEVFWNEKVPCGDGGIALGQMYLMAEKEEE